MGTPCICDLEWQRGSVFSDGSDRTERYDQYGRWHRIKCPLFLVEIIEVKEADIALKRAASEYVYWKDRLASMGKIKEGDHWNE